MNDTINWPATQPYLTFRYDPKKWALAEEGWAERKKNQVMPVKILQKFVSYRQE